MKVLFCLLIFSLVNISFGQNYNVHLDVYDYLTCDELEREIIKKARLIQGWDDYELNSSFLETIKIYKSDKFYISGYLFALVKFKNKRNYYVYCGISNQFQNQIGWNEELGRETDFSKFFHEYISPFKCDCQ